MATTFILTGEILIVVKKFTFPIDIFLIVLYDKQNGVLGIIVKEEIP